MTTSTNKTRTISVTEFKSKHELKEKDSTIIDNWIIPGLIQGCYKTSDTDEWAIPEDALPPYKTTCKPGGDYYTSIVTACCKHKHPCYQLYRVSETEFNGYIQQLISANLIYIQEIDGIDYYRATIIAQERYSHRSAKAFKKFILNTIEAVSKGVTSALI